MDESRVPEDLPIVTTQSEKRTESTRSKELPPKTNAQRHHASWKVLADIVVASMSVAAIVVSIMAMRHTDVAQASTAESGTIGTAYSIFLEIAKQQDEDWQLSHMFEMPSQYERTKRRVAQSLVHIDEAKRAEFILRERAIALRIFTIYEETLYLYSEALERGESARAKFLQEVLAYFTGRLLRNPRLLYYWSQSGGGLEEYFETATKDRYKQNVLVPLPVPGPDYQGPFGS